jgi:ABC-type nitrate/sulfonate/bicarbonate transport system substrate-binding protein
VRSALALVVVAIVACGGSAAPTAPAAPRQIAAPLEPVRVLYPGASPQMVPYWLAADAGLFARNGMNADFQQLPVDDAFARLLAGDADVYLTPLTPALVGRVADGADLAVLGGTPQLAIVVTRRLLATREFVLERFLRGTLEGIHAAGAQPEQARDLLAREGQFVSAEQADAALRTYLATSPERVPYVAASDVEPLVAARAGEDPRAADLQPERLLEPTLLRRLESSGFVASLYRA